MDIFFQRKGAIYIISNKWAICFTLKRLFPITVEIMFVCGDHFDLHFFLSKL